MFRRRPSRVAEYAQMRTRMIEALLDSDEEIAAMRAERNAATQSAWIKADADAPAEQPARRTRPRRVTIQ